MDKQEKFLYWLDIADYDMATADSMLAAGRYLYVVFMCQQALEKLTKGLYTYYIDDNIPRVHNISYILTRVADSLDVNIDEEIFSLLDKLSAYYLQGRYPSYKGKISQLVDKAEANEILKVSKEVFAWIRTLKELKK
jgi:HEPN domain-containing protein